MAVGNAAAGRVRRAFEDAGDGRGAERGGDENCGAREGELAGGCKAKVPQDATRKPAARREAEAVRQDVTQQPANTNEEGESRMDARGSCATKGDARRRQRDKRRRDNQPANRGKREEMRQRSRGGKALISRGCGGGRVERTRGGGINTTISRQTRDNHGDGEGEGDSDGDGKCRAAAITGLGQRPPSSSLLRLWMRSRRQRRRRPWSLQLRLRQRSRRTMPMAATAASPSSVARLSQHSWKCHHFRCRPHLVLTTCLRVFPTRRPDTADVSATSWTNFCAISRTTR